MGDGGRRHGPAIALDLSAATTDLAAASTRLTRPLPGRLSDPVLAGTVVTASAEGLTCGGTDREGTFG